MARRNLPNIDNIIMERTIQLCLQHGLSVSTKQIALDCDITDAPVFTYFSTKSNLLCQCQLHIINLLEVCLNRGRYEGLHEYDLRKSLIENILDHSTYAKYYQLYTMPKGNAELYCNQLRIDHNKLNLSTVISVTPNARRGNINCIT
ncbi:MAG: hypothetical protein PHW00_02415 [Clostridia bacterium]|nr:hypothetical protein [Clostridia bacterium]